MRVEGTEGTVKFTVHPEWTGYIEGWKRWTLTFKHLRLAGCCLDYGKEAANREELEALTEGWHFDSDAGELTVVLNQPLEDVELVVKARV